MHRRRALPPFFSSTVGLTVALLLGLSPSPASAQASGNGTSLAQRLVDSAHASHPEADEIGILARTSRGCYGIASTDESDVGERCEAEDIVPMKTGKPSVEREGSGFDVSVLLHDAAGNPVGVLAVGFEGGPDLTEASARKTVESIEAEMAASIPSKAKLLAPSNAQEQTFHILHKYDVGGDAGFFDYLNVDPATNRVYITRSTHVMVVDGSSGKVVGDIPDTPGVHGVAFAPKHQRGFITASGDSTVTMFDMQSLKVLGRIDTHTAGLDGIAYDDATDRIFTMDHSRDPGSSVAIDAATGKVVGKVMLDGAPEGAAADGEGKLFINIEDKSEIQVVDTKALKVVDTWPLSPGEGPSGLALDRDTHRLFSACHNGKTIVVDATSGKVVAQIPIGPGPDAIGWDPSQKLIYTPGGGSRGRGGDEAAAGGTITIAHEDSPDEYTALTTVETMRGARTIAVDPTRHVAYTFTPEYGPLPANAQQQSGRGRFRRGPVKASWLFVVGR